MKYFGFNKMCFDKMTIMRTYIFLPNVDCAYAYMYIAFIPSACDPSCWWDFKHKHNNIAFTAE